MERKLAVILAADVVGYSALMEQDEAGTFDRLKAHRKELFEPEVARHHGRIFKVIGDGVLVEFASVVDAVEFAVSVQRSMAERNASVAEGERMDIRIGINLGEVIVEGDDRYGEGVNVAARLQQLADPGGICVSGKVAKEVERKIALGFEPMGDQHVKNIAEPVAVYRVLGDRTATRRPLPRRWPLTSRARTAMAAASLLLAATVGIGAWILPTGKPPAAGGVPSLAVLPFTNMSGDSAQDHLGAGVAEEIITVLSSYPGLRVVSRSSSFLYDGPVKVQQVGSDLGVDYVLEGSIKTAGDKARVTAQLIDAASGDHVWADRFDREGNIVVLQEDVANAVYDSLAGLTGEIRKDEERRAWSKAAPSIGEFDYYLRGHQYFFRWTGEDIAKARLIFQEGLTKFPDSALLRIKLAATYVHDIMNGHSADPAADAARGWTLLEEARREPDLSRLETWLLHLVSAWHAWLHLGDFKRATEEAEAAIRLVPYDSFSHADMSEVMMSAGHPERAVEWLQFALAHDPRPMAHWSNVLGWAFYHTGRAGDAATLLEKAPKPSNFLRAVVYARLGKQDEARAAVADILAECSDCTVSAERLFPTGKRPQMAEPYLAAYLADLRQAGLPE